MTDSIHYAICVDDCGNPASLEVRKVYRVMEDAEADARGLVRVVDDSDEDYLYPAASFDAALQVQTRPQQESVNRSG